VENWNQATEVLLGFRELFPEHELQKDITKKIAFVYKSSGQLELAAQEYERIEVESDDEEVKRGSLLLAAELYEQAGSSDKAIVVYQRYIKKFPSPAENVLEAYNQIATIYRDNNDRSNQLRVLGKIVELDGKAGQERTDRTRYLAAGAALELMAPLYDKYAAAAIREPIKKSIDTKKKLMKKTIDGYSNLLQYEVADVTAAATYYMAEVYFNFSQALKDSERPKNLSKLELEEYELALEDQIYPFEERAINVHRKNVELLYVGVYSKWIDQSIGKLAEAFPAMYAREEESTGYMESIDSFSYQTSFANPEPSEEAASDAVDEAVQKPRETSSDAEQDVGELVLFDAETKR